VKHTYYILEHFELGYCSSILLVWEWVDVQVMVLIIDKEKEMVNN